jgi:hypothetical protein
MNSIAGEILNSKRQSVRRNSAGVFRQFDFFSARYADDIAPYVVQVPGKTSRPIPDCAQVRRRSGRLRLVDGLDAIEHLSDIALYDLNVIVVLQPSCGVVPSDLASRSVG